MWRLPGMLGRALQHLPRHNLRGVIPGAPSQDESQVTWSPQTIPVPNYKRYNSHILGVGSGPKYQGWKNVFKWISRRLSCHRMWDAISWGTLTVLALQLTRQIQFQASLPGFQRQEQCSWQSYLDQIRASPLLCQDLWLRTNILPTNTPPAPCPTCLEEASGKQKGPDPQPESLASHSSKRTARLRGSCEPEPVGIASLDTTGAGQHHTTRERLVLEKEKTEPLSLEEAMLSLQQQFQLSISIAFNFLGTENMRSGDCETAYSYFQKAADQGYSKAQYNVGLCYEHGKGTQKDLSKAIFYYQLAAQKGHQMAQYRYARSLLSDEAPREADKQRAVAVLKQAADAGLKEAQAYLGVLLTKEQFQDERKAVKYLWLAASNGDSQSKFHMGICYEKGFGVQKNLGEAMRYYQQSAALGNEPAQRRLRMLFSAEREALGHNNPALKSLRSFSSPSVCTLDTALNGAAHLPHTWSTGNLGLLDRNNHLGPSTSTSRATEPASPHPFEMHLVKLGFG
ncbi:death ligand signal enhancer isoform X1 [Monodelphis domestica]|uniref:DAP3-binding cell death enhancer 1 n=1 Tax=Monodelphis domestica TaxID=13616 RepID=F7F7R5_MONDO|nr:death ligand signal enhancer isoform X1 [Monodelphis domestica]